MNDLFLRSVLQALPHPAIVLDHEQRIIAANPAACALLGEAIVGRPSVMALRQPAMRQAILTALEQGSASQARHVTPGPSHEVVHRVTVSPIGGTLAGAPFDGLLCLFEDVSDQEQVEQMRRDFVANVSHELRTPLTALLGFIETLKGAARDDAAARERFLSIMAREAERMNRLVRDLLHLSRVESVERQRPTDRVDVLALLAATVAALRPMAEAARVEIDLAGPEGPVVVPADADQLMQVFHNLIENAVKYGGSGRPVTIRVAQEAAPLGPVVRIDVIDRGEGIDSEHVPRLTERFYRVDAHRSRAEGGTGLGLAIVKHIVHRHRGSLRIESARGKGSTFTVNLPCS